MIPFSKLFTLFIRTFSRPLVNYAKKAQLENPSSRIVPFFVWFGRLSPRIQNWAMRYVSQTPHEYKERSVEVALQKGVQAFYEILCYMLMIGIPMNEYAKSNRATRQKERLVLQTLSTLEQGMERFEQTITKILDSQSQWFIP